MLFESEKVPVRAYKFARDESSSPDLLSGLIPYPSSLFESSSFSQRQNFGPLHSNTGAVPPMVPHD